MTLANWISLVRLLLIPAFLLAFFRLGRLPAAGLYVLLAATDSLDGYLARRRREISTLGQILDPLADKLLVLTAFGLLVWHDGWARWLLGLLLGKELLLLGGGALLMRRQGRVIPASLLGKGASFLLFCGLTAGLAGWPAGQAVAGLGVVVSLAAGVDYLWRARRLAPAEGAPPDGSAASQALTSRRPPSR